MNTMVKESREVEIEIECFDTHFPSEQPTLAPTELCKTLVIEGSTVVAEIDGNTQTFDHLTKAHYESLV